MLNPIFQDVFQLRIPPCSFNSLLQVRDDRGVKLTDYAAYYEYSGKVKELIFWLTEKRAAMESLDLGDDVEATKRHAAKHGELRQEVRLLHC